MAGTPLPPTGGLSQGLFLCMERKGSPEANHWASFMRESSSENAATFSGRNSLGMESSDAAVSVVAMALLVDTQVGKSTQDGAGASSARRLSKQFRNVAFRETYSPPRRLVSRKVDVGDKRFPTQPLADVIAHQGSPFVQHPPRRDRVYWYTLLRCPTLSTITISAVVETL